jgi:hypothetical protein
MYKLLADLDGNAGWIGESIGRNAETVFEMIIGEEEVLERVRWGKLHITDPNPCINQLTKRRLRRDGRSLLNGVDFM